MKTMTMSILFLILFAQASSADIYPGSIDNGDGTYTFILQPGPGQNDGTDQGGVNDGKDAWVQYYLGTGYGGGTNAVQWTQWPYNFAAEGYGLYQFDVNSILGPEDELVAASVSFTHQFNSSVGPSWYPGPEAFVLESVGSLWDEMNVSWFSRPFADGMYSFAVTINPDPVPSIHQVSLDITPLADAWHSGAEANHGVIYRMADRGFYNAQDAYVHSSDSTNDQYRPALAITYRPGGVATGACEQALADATAENAVLIGQLDIANSNIQNLTAEVESLNDELSLSHADVAALADEVDALALANDALSTQLATANDAVQGLGAEVAALQAAVAERDLAVAALAGEVDRLTAENADLAAQLAAASAPGGHDHDNHGQHNGNGKGKSDKGKSNKRK
jgi:hypothetical protein